MTATTTWQIEFVDASGTTDLTAYVMGMQITQDLAVGSMASYHGRITLNNNGNLFTPDGGGTYQAFAWWEKVVKISCDVSDGSTTTAAEVAHLVVGDISFDDTGQYSTVQIRLLDPFTFAARDQVVGVDVTAAYGDLDVVTQAIMNGDSGLTAVPFPKFGATNSTVTSINKKNNVPAEAATGAGYWGIIDEFESGTAKDYTNYQVLVSGPAIVYPTTADYSGGAAKWTLNAGYVNRLLAKETVGGTDHFRTFEFTETDTADKFVFRNLSVQFNTREIVNQAQIQAQYPVSGEGSNTSNNTTSQGKLGIRSITREKLITWAFGGSTQTQKAFIGDFYTNRYADMNFTPREMTVSLEAINANIDSSSRTTYSDLLDCRTGLWNVAKITYTPTGAGSSKTYACVIVGRTINATPESTRITFRLLCAEDNQSLKLDDTNIGLLDADRLG